MSYATLDRHAQELLGELSASPEEQLATLERATERMYHEHLEQMARVRSLWRDAANELEVQKAANLGLLQQLRECRASRAGHYIEHTISYIPSLPMDWKR